MPTASSTTHAPTTLPQAPTVRYRAVTVWAVVCLALSPTGLLCVFHGIFNVLPMLALGAGWWALRRISRRPGELTGELLALVGMGLSLLFWLVGLTLFFFSAAREVPIGYTPLTWESLQLTPKGEIPQNIVDLENEYVFFRGYMYPTRQQSGIKRFVLVPSENHCSVCTPQLKSTEMIDVAMVPGTSAEYARRPVGVGGRLKIDKAQAANPLGGFPYSIQADYVK